MESWMTQDLVRPTEQAVQIATRHAHHRAELAASRRAELAARPSRPRKTTRWIWLSVVRHWRTASIRRGAASDA